MGYYKCWMYYVRDLDMTTQARETLEELYARAKRDSGYTMDDVDDKLEEYFTNGDGYAVIDADELTDMLHYESVEDIAEMIGIDLCDEEEEDEEEEEEDEEEDGE